MNYFNRPVYVVGCRQRTTARLAVHDSSTTVLEFLKNNRGGQQCMAKVMIAGYMGVENLNGGQTTLTPRNSNPDLQDATTVEVAIKQ